jgi:hypothetical protein
LAKQVKQEYEGYEQKKRLEQQKIDEIKAEHDRIEGELKEAVKIIIEVAPLRCTKIADDVIREAKVVRVAKDLYRHRFGAQIFTGYGPKTKELLIKFRQL